MTTSRHLHATVPPEVQSAAGFDPASSAGLFVGVSEFRDDGLAPVPFAVDDAVDLAHLFTLELALVQPGKVVLALSGEPVKSTSRDRLHRLLKSGGRREPAEQTDVYALLHQQTVLSGERGLFVTSLATHGFSDQGGDFLVASDSLRRRIQRTGIAVDELFDEVARSPSARRLVLLDACRERLTAHTRTGTEAASALSDGFVRAIAAARGQVVLTGTTLGGYAYDDRELQNGVFTAAVVEGLRGEAPTDERGFVTVETLARYVDERVSDWVRTRVPDHADRSRGIERRIEGAAWRLPLAFDPVFRASLESYRDRRDAALSRLQSNLGETITGAHYDDIVAALPEAAEPEGADQLLDEIEALDGSERMQRALVAFLEERRAGKGAREPVRIEGPEPGAERASGGGDAEWGRERVSETDGSALVYVPGGEYHLGSDDLGKPCKPVHRVVLRPFWIGKYPVTNEQYDRFVRATGHHRPLYRSHGSFNAPDQPVVGVSWFDATRYCEWAKLALPTEAQWEAAARGKDLARNYPWGNQPPESGLANCRKFIIFGYHLEPVGSHPRGMGPYGTMDQAGGVWEWCRDAFVETAYQDREGERDPFIDGDQDAQRVIRGGSYRESHRCLRAAFRFQYPPRFQTEALGFRVCTG